LIISNGVTSIANGAFRGTSSLTSVSIPNSVTTIGDMAFSGCRSLKSVTFPNSITAIGNSAFSGCSGLKNLALPNSIITIGDYAFMGCLNLTSVTMPDSVTHIGKAAFSDCKGLKSIIYLGNAPTTSSSNLSNVAPGAQIYYYSGTSGWLASYGGIPAVMLEGPDIGKDVGIHTGNFGFNILGASNRLVVVEASPDLNVWQPIWTNSLAGTSGIFSDPQWSRFPMQFYRTK
jgi:hypothetical protein